LADVLGQPELTGMNTALQAYEVAGKPFAEYVAHGAMIHAAQMLKGTGVQVDTVVIDRAGIVLAKAS
jgi:cobalt-precorrin-5B (C1)-methyltransferase